MRIQDDASPVNLRKISVALVLIGLSGAACSADTSEPTTTENLSTSTRGIISVATSEATTTTTTMVTTSTSTIPVVLSPEDVAGIWYAGKGRDTLVAFAVDGRYWLDPSGALGHDPDTVGTYELEGNETVFTQTVDNSECPAGTTARWRATVEGGSMTIEWLDHTCFPEAAGKVWEFLRISPDSAYQPLLPEQTPTSTFPAREGNLRGLWNPAGTSLLIELDGHGNYLADDKGALAWDPAESGTYLVDVANDEVVLTVSESRVCHPGDQLVLNDAFAYMPRGLFRVVRATAGDDCQRLSGMVDLVLISS